jgi:O-antigen/teichoic acid export membrane protein
MGGGVDPGAETPTPEAAYDGPRGSEGERAAEEIKQRAAAGAAVVGMRGIAFQLFGAAGTICLAHLLAPHELGAAAIGITLLASLTAIVGPGFGSALVRRAEEPERADLETVFALQLGFGLLIAAVAAVALWPFGLVGQVTAVMLAALPLSAFRAPNELLFSRNLVFRPLATVEVAELVVFYAWAVTTAYLGWGVWSLATGALVRMLFGSALMVRIGPAGLLWPRLSRRRARLLLGYGSQMQGFLVVVAAHEQAMNAGVGAIGGLSSLGLWSIANRILQVPFVLFSSLGRVLFPAMSRLVGAGQDLRPTIERSTALVAIATGLVLVPIAGAAPALVPALLGGRWAGAADVLPLAALGLMVGGPVAVIATTYLWGSGDATTPLWAVVAQAVARLSIGLSLLPALGMWGLGIGWCVASVVEAALLAREAERKTGARILRPLILPVVLATTAGGAAWFATDTAGPTLVSAMIGVLLAEGVYVCGVAALRPQLLSQIAGSTGQALRASVARAA